jgi:polyisoprenyl-phosphate glycosyltransferase
MVPQNELKSSISVIVACYNDAQAIPILTDRLVKVFEKCNILDYEIIFVDNGSTDDSEEVVRRISQSNNKVIGVNHSHSFQQTSQGSFKNGMEVATKDACILLDGDLQDPPELIEQFIEKWHDGYDVVYGIRHNREANLVFRWGTKLFYRLFDWMSSIHIPHDAGDFSLLDKKVVYWILQCKENDLLIRGLRAYVGFKQTGIKYFRPERMFGKSSNNFFKNIMWAKKGIFSFSRLPLDFITTLGFILTLISFLLIIAEIVIRFVAPEFTPRGITTIILLIIFFGSFNILAVSIVGEYIAKIFEEVKGRPIFIRKNIIKDGVVSPYPYDNDK